MFFAQKKRRTEEEAFSGGGQEQHPREGLVRLPIDAVYPNPDQPRRIFDEAALNELAHSIAQYGLNQPVLVRWREDRYELIAGERRPGGGNGGVTFGHTLYQRLAEHIYQVNGLSGNSGEI